MACVNWFILAVVSRLQSGYLYHYVLSVVIGLTLFISIYVYFLMISLPINLIVLPLSD